jgi:hypothetical protein
LTALYVEIDDHVALPREGRGQRPRLTDAELVCLAVAQVLLGFDSEHRWIRFADLLSKLWLDTGSLGCQLGGLGKFSNPLGGERRRGSRRAWDGVGRRQRTPVRCCSSGLPASAASPLAPAESGRRSRECRA